jgi:membrane-associated phospholipid phosphatase
MKRLLCIIFSLLILFDANAQKKENEENKFSIKPYIAPAVLITYGIICSNENGFPSSIKVKNYRDANYASFNTSIDDYIVFAPAAIVYGLDLFKVKAKHDFLNQTVIFAKTSFVTLAVSYGLKYSIYETRPDKSDNLSFPSAHTSFAFAYATVLKNEFKDKWYIGAAGYLVASGVGAMRILNDKHWFNDVVVGAGIGIASAELINATHKNKWHWKNQTAFAPFYYNGTAGLSFVSSIGR